MGGSKSGKNQKRGDTASIPRPFILGRMEHLQAVWILPLLSQLVWCTKQKPGILKITTTLEIEIIA